MAEGGGVPEGGSDLSALPADVAAQSLSRAVVIVPLEAALLATTFLTAKGRRIECWEGWVRMRDGGRTRSLAHAGSFALPRDPRRAADTAAAQMKRAADIWQRNPEYPGAELYFALTFGAQPPEARGSAT